MAEGINLNLFSSISDYIANNTNSKFVIGEMYPDILVDPYVFLADEVYTTTYSNWYESIFGYWFEGANDQRPLWTTTKNKYGSKNNSNWINSLKDLGEFSDLCGKASNLGMNTIWLFQDDDRYRSMTEQKQHLMQFCNSAWYQGFLRRYSQYTQYYYRCLDSDCATCESEEGNWVLYKTFKGDIREDFPAN